MKLLLLSLVLTSSCGLSGVREERPQAFAAQVAWFESITEAKVTTTVEYGKALPPGAPSTTIGWCYPSLNFVGILQGVAERLGDLQLKSLIAHEILHCQYKVGHVPWFSVMSPTLHDENTLEQRWGHIVKEIRMLAKTGGQL